MDERDILDMLLGIFEKKVALEVHEYDDKYILVADITPLDDDSMHVEFLLEGGRKKLALLDDSGRVYIVWDFESGTEIISSKTTNGILEVIVRK